MKYLIVYFLIAFFFFSCSNQSKINKIFNCDAIKIKNPESILDFNKNFRLTAPSDWKTELYFDKYQSEIFVADTTKQLTESFILIASFKLGNLNFDTDFHNRINSILQKENLQIINSGNESFQSKPTYWYVTKGAKNGFTHHQFNIIVKLSENSYFKGYSEIYGANNIEDRICESITILEKIEFLQ